MSSRTYATHMEGSFISVVVRIDGKEKVAFKGWLLIQ